MVDALSNALPRVLLHGGERDQNSSGLSVALDPQTVWGMDPDVNGYLGDLVKTLDGPVANTVLLVSQRPLTYREATVAPYWYGLPNCQRWSLVIPPTPAVRLARLTRQSLEFRQAWNV